MVGGKLVLLGANEHFWEWVDIMGIVWHLRVPWSMGGRGKTKTAPKSCLYPSRVRKTFVKKLEVWKMLKNKALIISGDDLSLIPQRLLALVRTTFQGLKLVISYGTH